MEIGRLLGISSARVSQIINYRKHRSRLAIHNALRRGHLVRPTVCPRCGDASRKVEAHHKDYASPLDVDWMCKACHEREHAK